MGSIELEYYFMLLKILLILQGEFLQLYYDVDKQH